MLKFQHVYGTNLLGAMSARGISNSTRKMESDLKFTRNRYLLGSMSARGISTSARRLEKDMQLTKNRYRIKRGDFSEITEEDVDFFRSVLGKEGVLTSDLDVYNTDWLR